MTDADTLTVGLELPSAQLLADQITTIKDLQFVMECCKRLLAELVVIWSASSWAEGSSRPTVRVSASVMTPQNGVRRARARSQFGTENGPGTMGECCRNGSRRVSSCSIRTTACC